ncbi:hypothetical protein D3C83_225010 [compost metagenome]
MPLIVGGVKSAELRVRLPVERQPEYVGLAARRREREARQRGEERSAIHSFYCSSEQV